MLSRVGQASWPVSLLKIGLRAADEESMKKIILLATISLAAFAQSVTTRVSVPFTFLAGEKMLPAGAYVVRFDPVFRKMELSSRGSRTVVYALPRLLPREGDGAAQGRFVFDQYGDIYVLRKFWNPGIESGYQLPQSKTEQQWVQAGSTPRQVSLR